MILADTSVWIQHFRRADPAFKSLLDRNRVAIHPLVIGELACGNLRDRSETLLDLGRMHHVQQATHAEVMHLIEAHALHGRGLGFIDLHLLASARLSHAPLLTRNKRLATIAAELDISAQV